jgi:hypothetical protein
MHDRHGSSPTMQFLWNPTPEPAPLAPLCEVSAASNARRPPHASQQGTIRAFRGAGQPKEVLAVILCSNLALRSVVERGECRLRFGRGPSEVHLEVRCM